MQQCSGRRRRRFRVGLENIPTPYRELVARLVRELLSVLGSRLVSVVVFGSVARGSPRRDSDLDVLIVAEGLPRSRIKRQMWFLAVEERLQPCLDRLEREGYIVELSPVLLLPEEARRHRPIYLDMVEDAVIVYDRGGFMSSVLGEVAERLRSLGAERVKLGRLWYWRLKRSYRFGEVIEV